MSDILSTVGVYAFVYLAFAGIIFVFGWDEADYDSDEWLVVSMLWLPALVFYLIPRLMWLFVRNFASGLGKLFRSRHYR